jgi:hypothetical protein
VTAATAASLSEAIVVVILLLLLALLLGVLNSLRPLPRGRAPANPPPPPTRQDRPSPMTFVVAGTYQQFRDWQRWHSGPCTYVRDANVLRGRELRPSQVVYVGTWFDRDDAVDIEAAAFYAVRLPEDAS